jgi:hypothetical protein
MENGEAPFLYFKLYKSQFQSFLFRFFVFIGSTARLVIFHFSRIFRVRSNAKVTEIKDKAFRSRTMIKWAILPSTYFMQLVKKYFPTSPYPGD